MTLVTFNAETGTNGTGLTIGNSGASVVATGTGTATFSSAAAAHGLLGYALAMALNSQDVIRFNTNAANNNLSFSLAFQMNSLPAADRQVFTVRFAAGFALQMKYQSATGKFYVNGGNAANVQFTTTETYTSGIQYRITGVIGVGATTSTGSYTFRFYRGDSIIPISTYTSTTANCGTAPLAMMDLGDTANAGGACTFYYDDLRMDDGSTTEIPPVNPPTASTLMTMGI